MRYELDANGYVLSVYWGCNSGNCTEYEGIVPEGYDNLTDWSENAIINAYYINEEGNLTLDAERLAELEEQIEQDYIDNMPILYKDLYGTNNVLDDQYQKVTAEGLVIEADNVKKINPIVWGTIEDYELDDSFSIDIVTQGKQMLKNDAETEEIAGITFTKNRDGSVLINGTSTEAIEYNISGGSGNASPIFALKNNLDYYLNLGGLSCSMKYYDGETTGIVYEGADGVINLPENKMVTQVLLTIPTGTTIDNKTIYPMLNYGSEPYEYEEYKVKKLPIVFEGHDNNGIRSNWVGFYVEEGQIWLQAENPSLKSNDVYTKYIAKGNVNLFDGYNLVYLMQNGTIGMTYNTNNLALEGTTTENNSFRIDEEGNVYATGGGIGGFTISEDKLTAHIIPPKDYTTDDLTKVQQYIQGNVSLTDEELELYDLNKDGKVTLPDLVLIQSVILANVSSTKPGTVEINSKSVTETILIKDGDGNEVVNIGLLGITTPKLVVADTTINAGFDVDKVYPVGSIYMSVNSDDPKDLFGGTWERIQGKFLLGANDSTEAYNAGKTGGSVNHVHNLDSNGFAKTFFGGSSFQAKDKSTASWSGNAKKTVSGTASTSSFTASYGTELGGKTASANGMPPFLAVYIWKRTA